MNIKKYKPIIGLEVHVELKTKSKMFCGCSADYFGQKPNTHTCPVCLGLPGSLPVPNQKAIEWCVMIGLALNCDIPTFSKFDRKNYFYPDLPKGYQISQYDQPFCLNGWTEIDRSQFQNDNKKRIRIRRVHMEEDTAKLVHGHQAPNDKFPNLNTQESTLIDFNRSGVPLVEIVTEPDFESGTEVAEYLKKLQQIVRYLGVSDADMEKGQMRLEPNISLKKNDKGLTNILPKYKVEVKNINSFRFVEKAIQFEIGRQAELLQNGKTPLQETRGWNEERQKTIAQRVKEEANDYRYFPEPDIPPLFWTKSQISGLRSKMPELPDQKLKRFKKQYQLSDYDAKILTREKERANFFEEAVRVSHKISNIKYQITTKTIANFIINKKITSENTLPAELIQNIVGIKRTGAPIDKKELLKIIQRIISENPKAVKDYKKGKENAIMFLIGQAAKVIKNNIDVNMARTVMENELNNK